MNGANAQSFNRVKILYVFAALPVGGAETLLLTEVEGLDKDVFNPLVCVISEKGPMGQRIEQMGYPVIPLHRMKRSQFDWRIIRDLRRLMENEKVQIVHTHLYDGNKYGRIAARLAHVPCILSTYHNVYMRRRTKYHLINWTLSAFNNSLIAVSEAVKKSVVRYDRIRPEKIRVIYNGIDPAKFQGIFDRDGVRQSFAVDEGDFLIGVIARLEEQKGHIFLLEALRRIRQQCPQIKILIVGDGKLRGFLEGKAHEMGLSGRVTFTGTRDPIAPVLSALDVFLLPSLWEGFSIAILEAMAMGLPVIATSVGGAAEVITPNQEGVLIPPGDIDSLETAMTDAALHREKYQAMGLAGRKKVYENFTRATHLSNLQSLYREVLAGKGISVEQRAYGRWKEGWT